MQSRWLFNVIELLINEAIERAGSDHFAAAFKQWYQFNKQHYTDLALEDQLQKDVIHFAETASLSINYLVEYLVSGEPRIPAERIPQFVQNVEVVIPAQTLVPSLNAFLSGQTTEKPPQVSQVDYVRLRELGAMDDRQAYLKEIYKLCRLYRPAMEITRSVLAMALSASQLAGAAYDVPRYQLTETITERILYHARLSMGTAASAQSELKSPARFGKQALIREKIHKTLL
jgi:hypothetical protein